MTRTENLYITRWAKKIKAIDYLGGKCIECSDDNIFHLSFHHKDPTDKEANIGSLLSTQKQWSIIQKELDKCELICENCHREKHNIESIDSRARENKRVYLEYKNLYECSKCGYDKTPTALELHHIKDKKINFSINKRLHSISDLEDYLKEELDKCDVLCANCHREEQVDIEIFNRLKDLIYNRVVKEIKRRSPDLDRKEVWSMYDSGMKQVDIARHFNVSRTCICNIVKTPPVPVVFMTPLSVGRHGYYRDFPYPVRVGVLNSYSIKVLPDLEHEGLGILFRDNRP